LKSTTSVDNVFKRHNEFLVKTAKVSAVPARLNLLLSLLQLRGHELALPDERSG